MSICPCSGRFSRLALLPPSASPDHRAAVLNLATRSYILPPPSPPDAYACNASVDYDIIHAHVGVTFLFWVETKISRDLGGGEPQLSRIYPRMTLGMKANPFFLPSSSITPSSHSSRLFSNWPPFSGTSSATSPWEAPAYNSWAGSVLSALPLG